MTRRTLACLAALCAMGIACAAQERYNAALPKYAARVSVQPGPNVYLNRDTPAESIADGDRHSRVVFTGTPYTYRIELVQALPLTAIGFAPTDIASEVSAREVEVVLSDGTRTTFELAAREEPVKRGLHYQEFPLGKTAEWVEVTVRSVYPAQNDWGGLGEIALFTDTDLDALLAVPNWQADAPTYIKVPPFDAGTAHPVSLPPRAKPDEWPRGLFTPQEMADLKAQITKPRATAAYQVLLGGAEAALGHQPDFPDPNGPGAQLKDRGDELAQRHAAIVKETAALGMAYALTGEAKYADGARTRLLGYAERYEQYPLHTGANKQDSAKVMAQRLSEAMWLIPQLTAYDYVHDALSADDRTKIEQGLIRPAVAMIRRAVPAEEVAARTARQADWRTADPYTGKSTVMGNWLNFYNFATILAGATLQDQDLIDLATADLREAIANGIGADAMWGEGAIGYQMFALQAMAPAVDIAARHGVDLFSYRDNRFKMLFDSPLRYAYPDGTMPGINDSGRAKLGDWSTMVYDYAWLRWGDPRHAGLVNISPRQLHSSEGVYYPARVYDVLPEPASISYPSTVFANLGYAIARDGAKYALLDYGPHGGVHGHLDKLNLILFGGDELGGEPVFHRYEDPLHAEWTRQTVAHNSLTIDHRSQQPTTGKLLVFDATPERIIMRAETAGAYPGVLLDRTVVMLPGAVVDLYRASSARPIAADRTLRFNGELPYPPFPTFAPVEPLGTRDGYQHLLPERPETAEVSTDRVWQTKMGALTATIAGVPGQGMLQCIGPDQDRIILLRQEGTCLDFACLYRLTDWGPAASEVRLVEPGKATQAVLEFALGGIRQRLTVRHGAAYAGDTLPVSLEQLP